MTSTSRALRLSTLGLLYVSQALPLGFFVVAMPAILRHQGLSLERIGALSALGLPWLLKWAWAPLVDRFGGRHGHYRGWLLPLQTAAVVVALAISRLDLATDGDLLLLAGGLFMLLAATQDVATDGLAVRLVEPGERGLANGIQVGGYYLGQVLGGGGAVWLVARQGWSVGIAAMAAILALAIPFVARLAEPAGPAEAASTRPGFGALGRFFRRPGSGLWVAVLLLWRAGETMAQWMFNPMLIDHGWALEDVGLLLGVVGSLAAAVGALLGAFLIGRSTLARVLPRLGLLVALALLANLLPAARLGGLAAIVAAIVAGGLAGGAATTALYTGMMARSEPATAATDFTLQQSLAAAGPLLAAGASGVAAATLGYSGHFLLAVGVQVVAVGLATRLARDAS